MKLLYFVLFVFICSCEKSPNNQLPKQADLVETELLASRKAHGQVVNVPIYSSMTFGKRARVLHFTAMLSIRNISPKQSINIIKVDYYDTNGKLIRKEIDKPFKLGPIATTNFMVGEKDLAGGSGASYMVEWESEKNVAIPVIEAIMLNTRGQLGMSFVSRGKEIEVH